MQSFSCCPDDYDVWMYLQAKHAAEGNTSWGIDGESGNLVDMNEYGVWEPYSVKAQTYKTAVEVITSCARKFSLQKRVTIGCQLGSVILLQICCHKMRNIWKHRQRSKSRGFLWHSTWVKPCPENNTFVAPKFPCGDGEKRCSNALWKKQTSVGSTAWMTSEEISTRHFSEQGVAQTGIHNSGKADPTNHYYCCFRRQFCCCESTTSCLAVSDRQRTGRANRLLTRSRPSPPNPEIKRCEVNVCGWTLLETTIYIAFTNVRCDRFASSPLNECDKISK